MDQFNTGKQLVPVDPGAIAAAEGAKARIQAAYVMALQKPRSEDQARARILKACRRPTFAAKVQYSKRIGGKPRQGPSIRYAELALREWGNILTESQTIYEDEKIRRIRITCCDLETNASFGKEITITKTVERKSAEGREVVNERVNHEGEVLYIVTATDERISQQRIRHDQQGPAQ